MPNTAGDPSPINTPAAPAGTGPGPDPVAPSALAYIEPDALVYIEKVRQATGRLGARELAPEDIRQALQAARGVAQFDVEAPITSPRREVQLVKNGVKRLSAWYMRYLSGQLNAFGASVVSLGEALANRTERLEASSDEMAARLGAVEARLGRLEAGAAPMALQPSAALPASTERLQHPASGAGQAPAPPSPSSSGTVGSSPRSRRNAPRRGQRP
jgi:hypothetical protein